MLAFSDVPLVLNFGRWTVDTFDQFTGGIIVPTNLDTTLTIVLWQGITDEDGVAGLGNFATEIATDDPAS